MPIAERQDRVSSEFETNKLFELATILSHQNDFNEITRIIIQRAVNLFKADIALLLLLNPKTHHTIKTICKEGDEITHPHYHSVQNLLSGWIIINRSSFFSQNIKNDARFKSLKLRDINVKSILGVPLWAEGVIIGTIILVSQDPIREFCKKELEYLEKIALIVAPLLRNHQHIQDYFESPLPEEALLLKYRPLGLLGKSGKFISLLKMIESAIRCDVRVILEGQSGTGKERIARAIHQLGSRNSKPFVAIDCGAIPEHLIESELFGHTKGAFTGAISDRKGFFEEAHGGTLFMDEINNLPKEMQSKLMRVLQENEIRPVGSNRPRIVDVRVITASSELLHKLVEQKKFREDLFYRLYVYPIHVPSLASRKQDIPLLAHYFLQKFAEKQGKKVHSFHEEILDYMKQRSWEGNIRELENFVERLVTLSRAGSKQITKNTLPEDLAKEFKKFKPMDEESFVVISLDESLEQFEEKLIRKALSRSKWNQSQAARALKIPVQTLRYRMTKLGIHSST